MSKFIDFDRDLIHNGYIPEHLRDSLEDYIVRGWSPGGFLTAMLAGDLYRATMIADMASGPGMQNIAKWIMHEMPEESWGSYEIVEAWIKDIRLVRTTCAFKLERAYIEKVLKY